MDFGVGFDFLTYAELSFGTGSNLKPLGRLFQPSPAHYPPQLKSTIALIRCFGHLASGVEDAFCSERMVVP